MESLLKIVLLEAKVYMYSNYIIAMFFSFIVLEVPVMH